MSPVDFNSAVREKEAKGLYTKQRSYCFIFHYYSNRQRHADSYYRKWGISSSTERGLRRDGMSETLANPEKHQLFLLLCTLVRTNEQENL